MSISGSCNSLLDSLASLTTSSNQQLLLPPAFTLQEFNELEPSDETSVKQETANWQGESYLWQPELDKWII